MANSKDKLADADNAPICDSRLRRSLSIWDRTGAPTPVSPTAEAVAAEGSHFGANRDGRDQARRLLRP